MASGRPEGSFVCLASERRWVLRSARVWCSWALRASRAVRRGVVVGLDGSSACVLEGEDDGGPVVVVGFVNWIGSCG